MTQTIDALKYEQEHSANFYRSLSIPVEIDSTVDFDSQMFRVWYGMSNLGIFRADEGGYLAEPFYGNPSRGKFFVESADDARDVIVAAYQASKGVM